jgi:shikimate dehydrogenase
MKKFGLIGFPLSHSFSKKYFSDKFINENIQGVEYESYPLEDISALTSLLIREPMLAGLNVTIPYKQQIIPFLDDIDEAAARIGAVNTIS